jgi:hypothetical protein
MNARTGDVESPGGAQCGGGSIRAGDARGAQGGPAGGSVGEGGAALSRARRACTRGAMPGTAAHDTGECTGTGA